MVLVGATMTSNEGKNLNGVKQKPNDNYKHT